jgi:undecaprenyl-diphosphatase
MARWILKPTTADEVVARSIRQHTTRRVEHFNRKLTFVADERILLLLTGGIWLTAHWGNEQQRQQANHLAFSVLTTCVLPHLIKRIVAQQRPDRRVVPGWRHGIPRSGKAYDAFPSGHAMHVGAIVSAVSWMYPKWASVAWGTGLALAATRIVLLAHWLSDVLAGIAMGYLVERLLRPISER